MMVVAHHYWGLEAGYAGVGFFFVLSGYVLATNYDGKVGTWPERWSFWSKRFARIYPLHLLTFLAAIIITPQALLNAAPSLLLLQSWFPFTGIYGVANSPSWSISNEAFFYALFPLLLGIRWKVLGFWFLGVLGLALLWPNWPLSQALWVDGRQIMPTSWLFYIFPPARLFEFALGIALARLPGRTGTASELGSISLFAASVVFASMVKGSIAAAILFVPASAWVIYAFSGSEGILARALSWRPLVVLGDASFALYMIHVPLSRLLGNAWWVGLLAVCLSVMIYYAFEKPAQRHTLRFLLEAHIVKVGRLPRRSSS